MRTCVIASNLVAGDINLCGMLGNTLAKEVQCGGIASEFLVLSCHLVSGRCKWIAAGEGCPSHAMDAGVFCMLASVLGCMFMER